jgi:integrase/recombinase XerD
MSKQTSNTDDNQSTDTESIGNGHIDWYMKRYRAYEGDEVGETTFEKRREQLQRFREWFGGPLADVESSDIKDFVVDMSTSDHGPKTISGYRWALSKFYRYMSRNDRIETDPMQGVPWKDIGVAGNRTRKEIESDDEERVHPLTAEEVKQLIKNVSDPKIRNEWVIRIRGQTEIRAGELSHVKLDDIDRDERTIDVRVSKSQPRTVKYQPSLATTLNLWIDGGHRGVYSTAKDSDYLLVTRKKEQMSNGLINKVVKKAAENAEIQESLYEDAKGDTRYRITSHSLRHTFAVMALRPKVGEGSMNLPYLRDMMGHSDISTTQKYLKYLKDDALLSMERNGPSL